jgi:flagellar export protein FliJ
MTDDLKPRQCWIFLAQKAQEASNQIQTELAQLQARMQGLLQNQERLKTLYEEYRQQANAQGQEQSGMGAAMNQRQFMNQLLGLMQRVEQDIQTVQLQQSQTRQRLLEAERERMKMTSLAEQDARNVQINLNKREQRQIDALGLSRFNQRDVH